MGIFDKIFEENFEDFIFDLEDTNREVDLADCVTVSVPSVYSSEILGMHEEVFQNFLKKVEAEETAMVFDVDDENPRWVSIIFEDGLEALNINRLTLKISPH